VDEKNDDAEVIDQRIYTEALQNMVTGLKATMNSKKKGKLD
jgi:hypothetical protein